MACACSVYVTACCLGKEIVVIDGLEEVIRQQKGIGRNLNQLTILANMGKVQTVYLKELTDAYAQVGSLAQHDPQLDSADPGTDIAYLIGEAYNIIDDEVEDCTTIYHRPERKNTRGPTMGGM